MEQKTTEYIAMLSMGLDKLKDVDCDVNGFYQAGVDTLAADRYGKLNLSISGIKSRDELVFTFAKKKSVGACFNGWRLFRADR